MSGSDIIMTTRELAEYIKIHEKTVIRQAQEGKIPGVKIGNQWRFHLDAIDTFLQSSPTKVPEDDLNEIIKTAEQIIPISRLTKPELIDVNVSAKDKDSVLYAISQIAKDAKILSKPAEFYRLLKEREELISTAVGEGVAIPHVRYPVPGMFKQPAIIIARTTSGIDYCAPDNKKVQLFFAVCAINEFVHLRLLAKISRFLKEEELRKSIFRVKTQEELMRVLLEFDRRRIFPLVYKTDKNKGMNDER